MPYTLIISNGHAEDLIGAAWVREWLRLAPGRRVVALPLVGRGAAYAGLADLRGPALDLPSGGFPFGSLENLRADLRAGLVGRSLGQWVAAFLAGRGAERVVVVGDSYALAVGSLAARQGGAGARLPLFHLQPLVSALYAEGMNWRSHLRELNALGANLFMPWELALGRRASRVYTRDAPTAQLLAGRGVPAAYRGSFAMDILPPPERDLGELRSGRPLLALLPGQRGDAASSLPVMLGAAARLPELQGCVAWPRPFEEWPELAGWRLEVRTPDTALATGPGGAEVLVLRGAFSDTLHTAILALGTAGTANEQAAGLGVPVLGFPTAGPQYVAGFAARQRRLLGEALTLCPPDPEAVARAARTLLSGPARERAAQAGPARIGKAGALRVIAAEISALSTGY